MALGLHCIRDNLVVRNLPTNKPDCYLPHAKEKMFQVINLNPLRAKFFRGNINIYLHFVSFLDIDMTQVVEILPQIRQERTYST